MRLAWFSPVPPVRSGIATCSAELVAALRSEHELEVFVDEPVMVAARGLGRWTTVRSAHDFVWMQRQRPFDLTVFQLGNSSHHDYMWPYLFRYPGLAVLHDAHLHHARAAALLREKRVDAYRAEFAANDPDGNADAAELAVKGFDSYLHYERPFTRLVVSASRATAVHNRLIRDELRTAHPDAVIEHVRLGHGRFVDPEAIGARRARARSRHGIPADAIVFGCFGGLAPEKRLPQILDAFTAVQPYAPDAWLLLAGQPAAHYDVGADITRRGLTGRVALTGYLEDDDELTDCIAASDVSLNLRWPTAREISGPWLHCLAAGRATVVVDLRHTTGVPSLDPRTWTPNGAERPVCVAIDILDEDHSLRLAMRRLATDGALRDALGDAARRYWRQEHSQEGMVDDYRRVVEVAARTPAPPVSLPPHLRDDRQTRLDSILSTFGVAEPWSKI